MQYSYETVNNSSYIVGTFEKGQGIINYQMQMLVNNEISNILSANKRQRNEDVQIFYNITSHISLAQALNHTKLTKAGMIEFIEGALNAIEDASEYQLVSAGILFDEEYIFVKPGRFQPDFIYVPSYTEDVGIEQLKNMLLSLIIGSKVEVTNDNFIQVMLETLNNPALTANDLRKLCSQYKSGTKQKADVKSVQKNKPVVSPHVEPQPTPVAPSPIITLTPQVMSTTHVRKMCFRVSEHTILDIMAQGMGQTHNMMMFLLCMLKV